MTTIMMSSRMMVRVIIMLFKHKNVIYQGAARHEMSHLNVDYWCEEVRRAIAGASTAW